MPESTIDWNLIALELADIEQSSEPILLAKYSLDYYHFSPILREQLQDKRGNLWLRPNDEAEVRRIARICRKYRLPLTVRGAGTGNYGQCIPLAGGVILDTTKLNQVLSLQDGVARVEAGLRMAAFDKIARETGWELRIAPSTYRTATIGGFVGGGSVGMGSINYGQISDRGNLLAAKMITLEDEPRSIELRGDEVQQVLHGYGTTGIITELELPLAPAYPWAEIIVTFADFLSAAKFGQALSDSDGIVKKLVSIHAAPIPSYFTSLQDYLPQGKHCALLMVAEFSISALADLIREYGGEITYQKTALEASKGTSLLEFTWNHTTLHARSCDPDITYLQTFYFSLEKVAQMYGYFGDEVAIHLEFLRAAGKAIPAGLQLFRYTSPARLEEIINYHRENGAFIANPHFYTIEDGGNGSIDPQKVAFKQKVDPYGLLNPGKMRSFPQL
jgi:FAD/FMN-containing dehydrogenase